MDDYLPLGVRREPLREVYCEKLIVASITAEKLEREESEAQLQRCIEQIAERCAAYQQDFTYAFAALREQVESQLEAHAFAVEQRLLEIHRDHRGGLQHSNDALGVDAYVGRTHKAVDAEAGSWASRSSVVARVLSPPLPPRVLNLSGDAAHVHEGSFTDLQISGDLATQQFLCRALSSPPPRTAYPSWSALLNSSNGAESPGRPRQPSIGSQMSVRTTSPLCDSPERVFRSDNLGSPSASTIPHVAQLPSQSSVSTAFMSTPLQLRSIDNDPSSTTTTSGPATQTGIRSTIDVDLTGSLSSSSSRATLVPAASATSAVSQQAVVHHPQASPLLTQSRSNAPAQMVTVGLSDIFEPPRSARRLHTPTVLVEPSLVSRRSSAPATRWGSADRAQRRSPSMSTLYLHEHVGAPNGGSVALAAGTKALPKGAASVPAPHMTPQMPISARLSHGRISSVVPPTPLAGANVNGSAGSGVQPNGVTFLSTCRRTSAHHQAAQQSGSAASQFAPVVRAQQLRQQSEIAATNESRSRSVPTMRPSAVPCVRAAGIQGTASYRPEGLVVVDPKMNAASRKEMGLSISVAAPMAASSQIGNSSGSASTVVPRINSGISWANTHANATQQTLPHPRSAALGVFCGATPRLQHF